MSEELVEVRVKFRGYQIENGRSQVSVDLRSVDLPRDLDRILVRFAERHGKGPIGDYEMRVIPRHASSFVHVKS